MPQLKERDPYAFPTQQLTVLGKIDLFPVVAHLHVYTPQPVPSSTGIDMTLPPATPDEDMHSLIDTLTAKPLLPS